MKPNNNSAGQLITLLFSINLHYCHTQELPLCQRRDSINRLPEQMYLPRIPKSGALVPAKYKSSFLGSSPSAWDVLPPFLQSLLEESTAEVSFYCPDGSQLPFSLSRQRSYHHRIEFFTTDNNRDFILQTFYKKISKCVTSCLV